VAGPCKLRVDLDRGFHGRRPLPQLLVMNSEVVKVFQSFFCRYRILTRYSAANNDNNTLRASPDPRYGMDGQAIEPAVQYVQKIKQRCDPDTYRQFLDILSRYHHTPDTIDEVCCTSFHGEYLTKDVVSRNKSQNRLPYFLKMHLISERTFVSSCQTEVSN
jgi:hypothetical protein